METIEELLTSLRIYARQNKLDLVRITLFSDGSGNLGDADDENIFQFIHIKDLEQQLEQTPT